MWLTYFMYWPTRKASLKAPTRMKTTLKSYVCWITLSRILLTISNLRPAKYLEYWSNQAEMKSRKKRQVRAKQ